MAEEFINQLSVVLENVLPSEDQTCCICLQEYGFHLSEDDTIEHPVRLPGCNHIIGSDCITKWVSQAPDGGHNTCPFCRRILFPAQLDGDHNGFPDILAVIATSVQAMELLNDEDRRFQEDGSVRPYIWGGEGTSPVAIAGLRNEDGSWNEESLPLTVTTWEGFSIFEILDRGDFDFSNIESFHERRAMTPRIGAPATTWNPLVNQQFRRDEERIHYLAYLYPELRQPPLPADGRGELSAEQLDSLFEQLQSRGHFNQIWGRSDNSNSAEPTTHVIPRPIMREMWDLIRDSGYVFVERAEGGAWMRVIWQQHDPANLVEPSWLEWGEGMLRRSMENPAVGGS